MVSTVSGLTGNENIGVGHGASAEIDRSSYGFFQMLDVYCRGYELDFCADKVSVWNPVVTLKAIHHFFFVDAEEEFRDRQQSEQVQTFG